eukprot:5440278-Prymnesium_polylepis.4
MPSLGDDALVELGRLRRLRVPLREQRLDIRGLWRHVEVQERWGCADPRTYNELVRWWKGEIDVPGKPSGRQLWLDMMRRFRDQETCAYEKIDSNDPFKLTVEHLFSQSMAGGRGSLLHGLMNLYAVEAGFNNCAEFKQLDSLAERAFVGERTARMHASL